MRILDFKKLNLKNKSCPICGNDELVYGAGKSLMCSRNHFGARRILFGINGVSEIEYVYYHFLPPGDMSEYLFFSFSYQSVHFYIGPKIYEFPLLDLDLSKIDCNNYKDVVKTLLVFS